jgi:hypothetical protein
MIAALGADPGIFFQGLVVDRIRALLALGPEAFGNLFFLYLDNGVFWLE